jgi:acetylcholinesterase
MQSGTAVGSHAQAEPLLRLNVIPNERFVFAGYEASAVAGKVPRIPAMTSTTSNEGSTLVPWPVQNLTEGPCQQYVAALDIQRFGCLAYNLIVYRNRMGPDVPMFRLQHAGTFLT